VDPTSYYPKPPITTSGKEWIILQGGQKTQCLRQRVKDTLKRFELLQLSTINSRALKEAQAVCEMQDMRNSITDDPIRTKNEAPKGTHSLHDGTYRPTDPFSTSGRPGFATQSRRLFGTDIHVPIMGWAGRASNNLEWVRPRGKTLPFTQPEDARTFQCGKPDAPPGYKIPRDTWKQYDVWRPRLKLPEMCKRSRFRALNTQLFLKLQKGEVVIRQLRNPRRYTPSGGIGPVKPAEVSEMHGNDIAKFDRLDEMNYFKLRAEKRAHTVIKEAGPRKNCDLMKNRMKEGIKGVKGCDSKKADWEEAPPVKMHFPSFFTKTYDNRTTTMGIDMSPFMEADTNALGLCLKVSGLPDEPWKIREKRRIAAIARSKATTLKYGCTKSLYNDAQCTGKQKDVFEKFMQSPNTKRMRDSSFRCKLGAAKMLNSIAERMELKHISLQKLRGLVKKSGFQASLGGKNGVPPRKYIFLKVNTDQSSGPYNKNMMTECQKYGLKPICNERKECVRNSQVLYIGQDNGLADGKSMKDTSKFPDGWKSISEKFQGLCFYSPNAHGNKAPCNVPTTGTSLRSVQQTSSFMCGAVQGAPFEAELGGKNGVASSRYKLMRVTTSKRSGSYSAIMIRECKMHGMKPVCDSPKYCKNDRRAIYFGQKGRLLSKKSDSSDFPIGWKTVVPHMEGVCAYTGKRGGTKAKCGDSNSWRSVTQNPTFMCAKNLRAPFQASLGAFGGFPPQKLKLQIVKPAMATGDYSNLMIRECKKRGMKALCDTASHCDCCSGQCKVKDVLYLGQKHQLAHGGNQKKPGNWPNGWSSIRKKFKGLCAWSGKNARAQCATDTGHHWKTPAESPSFMCAKVIGGAPKKKNDLFDATLGGMKYQFRTVTVSQRSGDYRTIMVNECQKHEMKPLCDHPNHVDNKCLFLRQHGHLSHEHHRRNSGMFPSGWDKIKCKFKRKCFYYNNNAKGFCNNKNGHIWQNAQQNPHIMCGKVVPGGKCGKRQFKAMLGPKQYEFRAVTASQTKGDYRTIMVKECNKYGMKPLCDTKGQCDGKSLYIAKHGHLSHEHHRRNNGHFPAGWDEVKCNFVDKCFYEKKHNRAFCNTPRGHHHQAVNQNPDFMCGKSKKLTTTKIKAAKKKAEKKAEKKKQIAQEKLKKKANMVGDCAVSKWGSWSDKCSKKCGAGVLVRTRTIVSKGKKCSGIFKKSYTSCNTHDCKRASLKGVASVIMKFGERAIAAKLAEAEARQQFLQQQCKDIDTSLKKAQHQALEGALVPPKAKSVLDTEIEQIKVSYERAQKKDAARVQAVMDKHYQTLLKKDREWNVIAQAQARNIVPADQWENQWLRVDLCSSDEAESNGEIESNKNCVPKTICGMAIQPDPAQPSYVTHLKVSYSAGRWNKEKSAWEPTDWKFYSAESKPAVANATIKNSGDVIEGANEQYTKEKKQWPDSFFSSKKIPHRTSATMTERSWDIPRWQAQTQEDYRFPRFEAKPDQYVRTVDWPNQMASMNVKRTLFDKPIKARFVRLHPICWHGNSMAMRTELFACKKKFDWSFVTDSNSLSCDKLLPASAASFDAWSEGLDGAGIVYQTEPEVFAMKGAEYVFRAYQKRQVKNKGLLTKMEICFEKYNGRTAEAGSKRCCVAKKSKSVKGFWARQNLETEMF